jgi:hypothetical protein
MDVLGFFKVDETRNVVFIRESRKELVLMFVDSFF